MNYSMKSRFVHTFERYRTSSSDSFQATCFSFDSLSISLVLSSLLAISGIIVLSHTIIIL